MVIENLERFWVFSFPLFLSVVTLYSKHTSKHLALTIMAELGQRRQKQHVVKQYRLILALSSAVTAYALRTVPWLCVSTLLLDYLNTQHRYTLHSPSRSDCWLTGQQSFITIAVDLSVKLCKQTLPLLILAYILQTHRKHTLGYL